MICHDIDANPTENISNIFLDIFRKRTYLNLYLGSWILSRDKFSSTFVFIVISQTMIAQLAEIRHVVMVFLLKYAVVNARYAENNSRFTEIRNHGFKKARRKRMLVYSTNSLKCVHKEFLSFY